MSRAPRSTHAAQRGFAIAGAFFLVIILGLLGTYIARITAQNQAGAALDLQGARAFEAARSGAEWAAFQLLSPSAAPACFTATTLTFPATVLAPFTTSVSCTVVQVSEAGVTLSAYQITARACNQPPCTGGAPTAGYVDRQVEVSMVRP